MKLIFSLTFLTQFLIYSLGQGPTLAPEEIWPPHLIKVIGEITSFNFTRPSQGLLDSNDKSLVIATNRIFTNEANMIMEQEVTSRQEFENTVEMTFTTSTQKFFEEFQTVTTKKTEWCGWIFGSKTTVTTREASTKSTTIVTKGQTRRVSNTTKELYVHTDKVIIPGHQRIRVQTFLETARNIKIPFTAKIRITGIAHENPNVFRYPGTSEAPGFLIQAKVRALKFNGELVEEDKYYVDYKINGYLIASFGLDFVMKSTDMWGEQGTTIAVNSTDAPPTGNEPTDGSSMDANYLWPVVIIVAIIASLIKYVIRSEIRAPEAQHPNNAIQMTVIGN